MSTAESEAGNTGHGVHTDSRDEQAERAGDKPLDNTLARDACNDRQPEERERKVIGCREFERKVGKLGRCDAQEYRADDAADEACHRCDADPAPALAAFAEFVAVKNGGRCRGSTGGVYEHGSDRAAVYSAAVQAEQQHHCGGRLHAVGQRQGKHHPHRGRKAGQCADDDPAEHTEEDHQQVIEGQQVLQTEHKITHSSPDLRSEYKSQQTERQPDIEQHSEHQIKHG